MQGVNKKSFIIITLWIIAFLASVESAFALYYYGGGYDGYDVKLGSNTDIVTISSAADQTFILGDSATVISAITVTVDVGQITAANDIRVKIPAVLGMTWDTTDTSATIAGSASSKVSATVSYSDSKTLLIDVTTKGISNLTLYIDGIGTTVAATDDKKKTIGLPSSAATFTGGSYDGYAFGWNSDAAEAELALFLGRFFLLFE